MMKILVSADVTIHACFAIVLVQQLNNILQYACKEYKVCMGMTRFLTT